MSETRSRSLYKEFTENSEFKAAMLSNEKHYKLPQQMSIYSDLDQIEKLGIFQKLQSSSSGDAIYCFYGTLFMRYKKYQYKVFLTLIKILEEDLPTMKGDYSILFFNTLCDGYDAFVSFKNMVKRLPQKYFQKLNNLFVVHPQKSISIVQWLSFGIVNKYLNKITVAIKKIDDLSQYGLSPSWLYETLPKEIVNFDKTDSQGQESKIGQKRQIKEKPNKVLEEYELSKTGIPMHLRTLLSYFEQKPEKLRVEGIFRVNGSVDDINMLEKSLSRKYYEVIMGVQDPHPICSLIKNFFTSLKDPIFSYDNYEQVLKTDPKQYGNLATAMLKNMPLLQYKILLITLGFLVYRVAIQQKYNKMNLSNIAVCFYPCLFRSRESKNQDILHTPKFVSFLLKIMNDFSKYFSSRYEEERVYRQDAQQCIKQLKDMIPKSPKKSSIINNLQSKIPSKPNQNYYHHENQQ